MCEIWERMESPGAYVDNRVSRGRFCLVNVLFRTTFPRSDGLSPADADHDAVGQTAKKVATTNIKAHVHSIWAKGCMLDIYLCGIWLDMTIPLCWGENVITYMYNYYYCQLNDYNYHY